MKIAKRIASIIAMLLGAFFLLNMAGDIQLGFGIVLLAIGFLALE